MFGKFLKWFLLMLIIPVFVVYFFIDFFLLFFFLVSVRLSELLFGIREAVWAAWTDLTSFCKPSLFSPRDEESEKQNLCPLYYVVNKDVSTERPTKAKKFVRSFHYKTKYSITWFSQKYLKNYKDVVTNSKLREFYFYCKICTNISCNSVTHQKSEKERHVHFFILKIT